MTDKLDKMRAKQPHIAARPADPPPAAEAPAPPPERPKKVAGATIRHQCGHEKAVAEYANMACPACRDKTRQDRVARKREKKAGTRREVAAAHAPNPEAAFGKHLHGRLPNLSRFVCNYDASTETWFGELTVGGEKFKGSASGLFRLLHDLDRLYRNSIDPSQGA
jgi:hypothetical protein